MNLFKSACVHLVIITCLVLFGSAVHSVEKQSHVEHLVFMPADLPVPTSAPSSMKQTLASVARPTPAVSVSKLAIGNPSKLSVDPERAEQPRLVAMSVPGSIELPSETLRVVEAPQVTVVAFNSPVGSPVGHSSSGTVSQAGFGRQMGGSGSNIGAHVMTAGFDVAPATTHEPAAVRAAVTSPVITYEPRAVYSEAARRAHIQGTVDLKVKFKVDGSVEVLGIVNGLPGLNESALAVARGIKFVPAASDFTTLIHVRFELL
jgi:TonB family protein